MNRRTGRYKNVYADNLKGKQVVLEKVITKEVIITNDPAVQSGVGTTVIDTDGPVVDGGSALTTLAALTDTTISSPATDELLQYNGSAWVNSAVTTPTASTIYTDVTTMTGYAALMSNITLAQFFDGTIGDMSWMFEKTGTIVKFWCNFTATMDAVPAASYGSLAIESVDLPATYRPTNGRFSRHSLFVTGGGYSGTNSLYLVCFPDYSSGTTSTQFKLRFTTSDGSTPAQDNTVIYTFSGAYYTECPTSL